MVFRWWWPPLRGISVHCLESLKPQIMPMCVGSLAYSKGELWCLRTDFFFPSHNYSSSQRISLCYGLDVSDQLKFWMLGPLSQCYLKNVLEISGGSRGGCLSINTWLSFCFWAAVKWIYPHHALLPWCSCFTRDPELLEGNSMNLNFWNLRPPPKQILYPSFCSHYVYPCDESLPNLLW